MNRSSTHKFSFFLVASLCFGTAAAGETTDVGVKGRIQPDAIVCNPTVWTTPHYGTLAANTLKPDGNGVSVLEPKRLAVSARCSQPSKFSLRFTDAQQGTAVADGPFIESIGFGRPGESRLDGSYLFGLGQDSQQHNIGALLIESFRNVGYEYVDDSGQSHVEDGVWLEADDETWTNVGSRTLLRPQKDYTVTPNGGSQPMPRLLMMMLTGQVVPAIDTRPGQADLKNEINFSGRITVEVRQL